MESEIKIVKNSITTITTILLLFLFVITPTEISQLNKLSEDNYGFQNQNVYIPESHKINMMQYLCLQKNREEELNRACPLIQVGTISINNKGWIV